MSEERYRVLQTNYNALREDSEALSRALHAGLSQIELALILKGVLTFEDLADAKRIMGGRPAGEEPT